MLDERALAVSARETVLQAIRAADAREQLLRNVVESVVAAHPELTEDYVKAAVVSLLGRDILELTADGNLRYIGPY